MASELIKWFDAITATCCNVHPKIFEDINLDVAKEDLGRVTDVSQIQEKQQALTDQVTKLTDTATERLGGTICP